MNDLNAGHIDFYITDSGTIRSQINPGGRLRALMTTSRERFASLPDIPSAEESELEMDLIAYWALYVPTKTPKAIIDPLASWIQPIVTQDDTRKFLANLGFDPWVGTTDSVNEMIERESRLWGEYVKIASIERQ
jgi:tripartite-type tricarboxylate transporter receptor subunit TctC